MRECCKTNGFYLIDDITKEKTKEQEHIKKLDKPQGKRFSCPRGSQLQEFNYLQKKKQKNRSILKR